MNNVFSSLNSLVWLLVVILIIAAVVTVIRAVTRPRGGAVVEQPVVQQQPPPPPPAAGLAPGWYPDQNDASLSRYFDGRAWTSSTQPRH